MPGDVEKGQDKMAVKKNLLYLCSCCKSNTSNVFLAEFIPLFLH